MVEVYGILGAGGHGKVVADLCRALGHRIGGFIDSDQAKYRQIIDSSGGTVVLGQEDLLTAIRVGVNLPAGLSRLALGIGNNDARFRILGLLPPETLLALVHPAATVSPTASLGVGTVVFAAAVINADVKAGRGVIVNSGAIVEHDCILEDAVHVSPGAVLAGGARVATRGWIGAGATLLPGVTVGADAIVGAGAVCLHDVEAGTTVVGNPARVIERRTA